MISEATLGDFTANDFRDSLFFLDRDRFADQVLGWYRDKARFRSDSERHFENFSRKSALPHITRAIDFFLVSLDRRNEES